MSRPIAARLLFISKEDNMNHTCRGVTTSRNCTLKADDVCSKFFQNGIPVLEGIPSALAIRCIDSGNIVKLRTDDIEVLSGPRSGSKVLQDPNRLNERRNKRNTHKVPRQDSHPLWLTEWCSEVLIPCCGGGQGDIIRFSPSRFVTSFIALLIHRIKSTNTFCPNSLVHS